MWYPVFDETRYMVELLVAGLLFTLPACKRRKRFWLRICFGGLACMCLPLFYCFVISPILKSGNILASYVLIIGLWYVLLVTAAALFLYFCFEMSVADILWTCVCMFSAQHLVQALINELILFDVLVAEAKRSFILYALVSVFGCLSVYLAIYFIFAKYLKNRDNINQYDGARTRILWGALLFLLVMISYVNQYNAFAGYSGLNTLVVVSDAFSCIVVLSVLYLTLRNNRLHLENKVASIMYRQTKSEYDTFRVNAEFLETKIHDIKKELKKLPEGAELKGANLDEVKNALSLHDAFVRSGNAALDVVLTEKNVSCIRKGIRLNYSITIGKERIMEDSDLYALFTNLLDNAINYVEQIEGENRYIDISVKRVGGMIYISEDNYCAEKLDYENGLPITTSFDKEYHGYGVKSIKLIVEKYGGKLKFSSDGNTFSLDIIYPEKNQQ